MTLEAIRRWYAEEVAAVCHLTSSRVVEAFARVPREVFLGPGPWQIATGETDKPYRTTSDADPRHIYHNVVVALDPVRQLNNGQPTALARWIEALDIADGDSVAHVGCGVGYYTAIIAELAGARGRVVGYEVDAELAARARALLATGWPQVEVRTADAAAPEPGAYDAMFVNAGVTHAPPAWLAALRSGGRLVMPLTFQMPAMLPHGVGAMIRIQRDAAGFAARVFSQVGIYPCAIARDPAHEPELRRMMDPSVGKRIARLDTSPHERGPDCVIHIAGFCLRG